MDCAVAGTSRSMTSLWLDRPMSLSPDLLPDRAIDVVVVGAGLTGLSTALLLARAGKSVAVVEARTVGAVATGNTTAKLSLLQGTHLSRMRSHQSEDVARAYVEANTEGMEWLLRFCEEHGVAVQRRPALTYAASEPEIAQVRREHEVASSLGLPVRWLDRLDVPFPAYGATVLEDQAQFDPMDVLDALLAQLRAHGGTLHEGRRVTGVSYGERPRTTLEDGTVLHSDQVVLATGTPVLDRGLFFAKLEPQRSYALAFTLPGSPPALMALSAGSDSRSVRDAPRDGGDLLLVGGSGHTVGRTRSERAHVDALREWTQQHFPGARETHQWSAQDYASYDGLPHVGPLPRGRGRIYAATGFEKWGMTNGVAAARTISGQILGGAPSWSRTLARRTTTLSDVASIARTNAGVGLSLGTGIARVASTSAPRHPDEGEGSAGRGLPLPTGRGTSDGVTCAVAAVCTHLGGILRWNDEAGSWDCPLHGSRFAVDGSVLEGPATRPLRRRAD